MIYLKEKYMERDQKSEELLKEAFEFKNKKAPVMIDDVNYWLFGEIPENIPDGYCSDNPEIMMKYQLDKIQRHNEKFPDDCYQGFLMPWFGTSVLASGFGMPYIQKPKMDPAIDISPIKNPDEIKNLKMPDPNKDGQMPQVLNAIDYFKANCDLPIGITDCQGPLTTAISIVGYENFIYWLYEEPETIHLLMDMVTVALIDWIKVQKQHAGKSMDSSEYILGVKLPEGFGGVWIADDDAVMFNDESYREFVVPYNSRVLKAFGGGGIHYCGTGNQHIESYQKTEGLTVIHNMNLDHLDKAVEMRNALAEKKIPYILADFVMTDSRMDSYYKELYSVVDQTGLIVAPYPAPAVALNKGKYEASSRDQVAIGLEIEKIINKYR